MDEFSKREATILIKIFIQLKSDILSVINVKKDRKGFINISPHPKKTKKYLNYYSFLRKIGDEEGDMSIIRIIVVLYTYYISIVAYVDSCSFGENSDLSC